jgi:hypothetical protein
VGRYANGGREWQPAGEPERVLVHDFPDDHLGKAIPYGVYDLGANTGWVSVGKDATPPRSPSRRLARCGSRPAGCCTRRRPGC